MYCSRCGKELPDDAKFCTTCGQRCDDASDAAAPAPAAAPDAPSAAETDPEHTEQPPKKARKAPAGAPKKASKKIVAVAVCAVLILCAAVGIPQLFRSGENKRANALCEQADSAWQDWRIQDAARDYYAALEIDPKCTDAYLGLSRIHDVFFSTGDAIRILNDGLNAGADADALNARIDELAGPDVGPSLLSILNMNLDYFNGSYFAIPFHRYSRVGNCLYSFDVGTLLGNQGIDLAQNAFIEPEDDTLRPASYLSEIRALPYFTLSADQALTTAYTYNERGMTESIRCDSGEGSDFYSATQTNQYDSASGLLTSSLSEEKFLDISMQVTTKDAIECTYTGGRLSNIHIERELDRSGYGQKVVFDYSLTYMGSSIQIQFKLTFGEDRSGDFRDFAITADTDSQRRITKMSYSVPEEEMSFSWTASVENGNFTGITLLDGNWEDTITLSRNEDGQVTSIQFGEESFTLPY